MSLIALTAGGTGGHLFPAQAVSETFDGDTILITDDRGQRWVQDGVYTETCTLAMPGFGNNKGGKFAKILALLKGFIKARRFLKQYKPSAIIGFGGYASVPSVLAAKSLGIQIILHEQNAVLGRSNRVLAKLTKHFALSYPDTLRAPKSAIYTGLPLRQSLKNNAQDTDEKEKLHILILGGSQGASILEKVVPALSDAYTVTHQCRPDQVDVLHEAYKNKGITADIAPFFDDMATELNRADIVIARAGASTIAELQAFGKPSILVPFAAAMDDHQSANAAFMAANGASFIVTENDLKTPEVLKAYLDLLEGKATRIDMAKAARALYMPNAAADILSLVRSKDLSTTQ